MSAPRIAVVGAGMAGLACARRLDAAGLAVELFDKGRRAGGRLATRRLAQAAGDVLLDHGAQYFTARSPEFRALCAQLETLGVIERWRGLLCDERAGETPASDIRYLGAPGMNDLPRWLAQGLSVRCETEVSALAREAGGWRLECREQPAVGGFTAVVVAIPAEQAARLLAEVAPALAASAAAARTAPCWAGLFGFAPEARWPEWQALRPRDGEPLAWLARARNGAGMVVHASPAWSRTHLEDSPAEVDAALRAALARHCPALGPPAAASVHRWRYALVEQAAGTPCEFDSALGLGVCGDWRLGPRVELAWSSGDALGRELIAALGAHA